MATTVLGTVASQPAMIGQTGRPKLGKTVDDLFSFPRGIFIAAPGALKGAVGVCGYEPKKVFYVEEVREATALVRAAPVGKFDALVIDDFSLLLQRTVASIEKRLTGFALWGAIYKQTLELREAARTVAMHTVLNAHEQTPGTDETGKYWAGTMALPGKKLPYEIPAACDVVVRAVPPEPDAKPEFGWPVRYFCNPASPEWITGDRHNVLPVLGPMNLAEALRLVGFVAGNPSFAPRRLEGLEWQEALVEKGASAIVAGWQAEGATFVVKPILSALFDKAMSAHTKDERHAMWAVRDAYDRAVLRHGLSTHRRRYYQF
jgi:hypothetical protein